MSNSDMKFIFFLVVIFIILSLVGIVAFALRAILLHPATWIAIAFLGFGYLAFILLEYFYFKSEKFNEIMNRFQEYVNDCNGLNQHINGLQQTFARLQKTNYGNASLVDTSTYNYKRRHQAAASKSEFIYECSAYVCKNAENQPFKYLCKYFNISTDEKSLNVFEEVLNNFSAAEEGKELLKNKLEEIKESARGDIPWLIRVFSMRKFMRNIGLYEVDFVTVYFPIYSFRYISHGGNKSTKCDIKLDIDSLNKFVAYLSEIVRFNNTAAGQRLLMTSKLRESIKVRDNYSCRNCGISTIDEAHLLLEIDHIIPVSKGGLTIENNLQTLCWRCNRAKGAKVI